METNAKAAKSLIAKSDYLGLSALDWLMDNFDRFSKPHAMVETNNAAERLAHGTALLCGWLIRPYGAACLARAARYPQT